MKIENWVSRSYSGDDPEVIAERQREIDIFSQFLGKKVKIGYTRSMDVFSGKGAGEGKIKLMNYTSTDKRFMFLPGKNRSRGYWVTLGLYDGFKHFITINEINEI